jgi:hypothetical protein
VQARIQSGIMEQLAGITTLKRVPEKPFTEFALGRYQSKLQEAMADGDIDQKQLQQLTEEEMVRAFIDTQRNELEKEFGLVMALEEIFRREELEVDNELVEAQTLSMYEDAQKSGQENVDVRLLLPSSCACKPVVWLVPCCQSFVCESTGPLCCCGVSHRQTKHC